ncbi:Tim44 domain-containing protein [Roseateles sp. BYS180W]|uniref:Tim44 domain-containing protein n=1 Tax=Roseateles rivi TaxID=3299028 RepID=A0ABW7FRI8_9BURK
MKSITLMLIGAVLSANLISTDAYAKRLGSGGMKRSTPTQQSTQPHTPAQAPTQQGAPAQQAAPVNAGTAAAGAAAAPKRSWMGPIAGLAAGLGLAALASHFGFGEELASFMMMMLLGVVLMTVIGYFLKRRAANQAGQAKAPQAMGMQWATAGAPASLPSQPAADPFKAPATFTAAQPHSAPASTGAAPAGFDVQGFVQVAKRVFIRMQAANDAGDQADLRRFTTPEMYAVIQQELLERKGPQQTDVVQLDAQVIEVTEEAGQNIVSVRFSGLIREQQNATAERFDEVWHLTRPVDGSREWAIAGIQASV